jgi:hypothetical protein
MRPRLELNIGFPCFTNWWQELLFENKLKSDENECNEQIFWGQGQSLK